jgi:hypothetical protein
MALNRKDRKRFMSGQCSVLIAMVRTPLDEIGSGLAVFGIIAIGR